MELRLNSDCKGLRLDVALAAELGSRSRAARLIDDGAITVDGCQRPRSFVVSGGELIVVSEPDDGEGAEHTDPTAPSSPFSIVFEDDHLLVIDKTAGLVVHPAKGHWQGTLSQALVGRAAGGDSERPGIVHRLDRYTSGLLVVAREEESHRRLKAALQAHTITREYLALCDGCPPARTGTIDAPIGRDRRERLRMSTDTDKPRAAITHFEVLESMSAHALLRLRLQTGRTHQIRAHLLAIGHPVAGDPLYGRAGELGLNRQFLHATRLAFEHPFSGEPLEFHSPLPDDLQLALRTARTP